MSSIINKKELVWNSQYNIGDFKVDTEHQSLFVLAKKAFYVRDVLDDEKAQKELKNIIHSLYKYVAIHFKNEEMYMQKIQYPELLRHKEIHKDLLITLHEFVKSLNSLSLDEIEKQLFEFITEYFITHITTEDIDIGIWKKPLKALKTRGEYQEAYSMENEHLDNQHKELFEIANEAFMEVDNESKDEKVKDVLRKLYQYMKRHFTDEEKYMISIKYPFYKDHYDIHKNILKDCNALLLQINDKNSELFEKELAVFIDKHLINHVIDEDHKISLWYKHNK